MVNQSTVGLQLLQVSSAHQSNTNGKGKKKNKRKEKG